MRCGTSALAALHQNMFRGGGFPFLAIFRQQVTRRLAGKWEYDIDSSLNALTGFGIGGGKPARPPRN